MFKWLQIPDPGPIKLNQIENSDNYFDDHGYVYSRNNNKNLKNLYLRCRNSKLFRCPARAILANKNTGDGSMTKKHNHLPDKELLQKAKFDKILDGVYQSNPFKKSREMYLEARRKISAADHLHTPPRKSYGSFLNRRRRKKIPKIPHSIEEFEEFINDERFQEYRVDHRNFEFYRGIWKDRLGRSMVAFLSESAIRQIGAMSDIEMLMDGTFKVLPRHLKFCQLYIMSFIYEERSYPFAFVFMEKRDFTSYDALFENLKTYLSPETFLNVMKCMSDYESAVRKAMRKHFPNARISGCFFHFVKAIKKNARRFGLIKKKSSDGMFDQAIQEVCVLALLPNNFVDEGFRAVDAKCKLYKRWKRFKKYWNRQWKSANISVYGLQNRCNNFLESLNGSLNSLNGKSHQDIWVLLRNLRDLEMDKTDELEKHKLGAIFKRTCSKRMIELNKKIEDSTKIFEATLNVEKFIRNMTYQSKFDRIFKSDIVFKGESDEIEENDDESDEIFEGNYFNEACIFQPPIKPITIKRKAEQGLWYIQQKKNKSIALS